MKAPPRLASIDIGSNSVLLLVGRIQDGKLQVDLQRKETVRLGGALDSDGNLQAAAIERGLECLHRYAALIAEVAPQHRRVVATQTLREAHNREIFLSQARAILKCPVELISGEREATLIYQGVSNLLPNTPDRRLVIDIGGRSTEVCIGEGTQLHIATSCPIGSVAWAQRFFRDGLLSQAHFSAADDAAQTLMKAHLSAVIQSKWEHALGSSGTAGAISKALHQAGHPAGQIERSALFELKTQLIQAGHIDRLPLHGLREELRPVIGGGVSIMCAVFEVLQLQHMRIAQGALRHGLIFEMHQALSAHANMPSYR